MILTISIVYLTICLICFIILLNIKIEDKDWRLIGLYLLISLVSPFILLWLGYWYIIDAIQDMGR